MLLESDRGEPESLGDDRLRLMSTCCHPASAQEAQVALTLRLLGGLSVAEIARALLVDEAAMAKRLTRAKQKIAVNRVPYRVPSNAELPDRLSSVLAALYLILNEGYLSSRPDVAIRADLCTEAIRLARILADLVPDESEAAGLLALMLLTEARRTARIENGSLVSLPEQRRWQWDADLIAEGHAIVRECLRRNRPGPYQVQACINAVHTEATTASETDWRQIVALYDQLFSLISTPVVAMNRAIAVAEVEGPEAGLAILNTLDLNGYHAFDAARADLLRRRGSLAQAASAYFRAIELTANSAERRFLAGRIAEFPDTEGPGT